MIDPLQDPLIPLGEAAEIFPRRRRGKKPHVNCIKRYCTEGFRGVVLESIQAGATRATTARAVAEFLAEVTRRSGSTAASTGSHSNRESDVSSKLDDLGF